MRSTLPLSAAARAAVFATLAVLGGCKQKGVAFDSVNPPNGRLTGSEEVRIRGGGLQSLGSVEVRIGGRPASNVGILGDDTLVLTTPQGEEANAGHALDVQITTSHGVTYLIRNGFTYNRGAGGPGSGPNDSLRRRL